MRNAKIIQFEWIFTMLYALYNMLYVELSCFDLSAAWLLLNLVTVFTFVARRKIQGYDNGNDGMPIRLCFRFQRECEYLYEEKKKKN